MDNNGFLCQNLSFDDLNWIKRSAFSHGSVDVKDPNMSGYADFNSFCFGFETAATGFTACRMFLWMKYLAFFVFEDTLKLR